MEPKPTPEESLRIIRQSIELAKGSVREDGFHLLLWGQLIVLVGLADFYQTCQKVEDHYFVWLLLPVIGVPIAAAHEWRQRHKARSRNTIHQWYGLIWLGYGITQPMLVAHAVLHGASPVPPILAVTGFAIFVSGIILRYKPMLGGAIFIWIGALCGLLIGEFWHSLIMVLSVAGGYVIPGYLLQKHYKR
jgi:hypothetical protein